MKKEERNEINMLLNYITKDILHYGETKKSPPLLRKKINELMFDENKEYIYTPKMVLYSFMINKSKIEYAFSVKDFKDERHKINYMMVIVSNSMNDIKNKVVALQNLKEKNSDDINNAEYLNRNNVLHGSQKYVKKTVELDSEKVEDLW